MKGLAVSNAHFIRQAHNALARSVLCITISIHLLNQLHHRPADIRGATNVLAIKTLEDAAKAERSTKPPPAKRRKLATTRKKKLMNPDADPNQEEAYHFIGYVPFRGKVWELDGLKSKPVEVGELPASDPSPSGSGATANRSWMDIVRPVLRMKMRKYGGGDDENGSIKFNLLAIVKDQFCKVSDQLELLKREQSSLTRELDKTHPEGWDAKASYLFLISWGMLLMCAVRYQIDPALLNSAVDVFTTSASFQNPTPPIFAPDFGAQKMERDIQIMKMEKEELPGAWERCIENALSVKTSVEDELEKPRLANVGSFRRSCCARPHGSYQTENIKRTFDYEPFIKEFIKRCQKEGKFAPLLNRKKQRAGVR